MTSVSRFSQQEGFIEELTEIFPASNTDADADVESVFAPIEASELIATLTLFDSNHREIFGKIWRVDASQGSMNLLA